MQEMTIKYPLISFTLPYYAMLCFALRFPKSRHEKMRRANVFTFGRPIILYGDCGSEDQEQEKEREGKQGQGTVQW